ncbi:hypothetical protein NQ314_005120 [Rhamnusium bicolor]|uniref:THAP-type domain-containing protein n=1 Tax=Rhamnusium bicolor TaxID=1586634 RepID=A0AAV8ZJI5_9CUCU|nr:hypothetical protein NQ314_005120 [Rhamnusium bicolor]
MAMYCSAYGCTNEHDKGKNIRFHGFPFNRPPIIALWLAAIRRVEWKPSKYSKLCSAHFVESDYQNRPNSLLKILRDDAVPSIFNIPEHLQKKSFSRKNLKRLAEDDRSGSSMSSESKVVDSRRCAEKQSNYVDTEVSPVKFDSPEKHILQQECRKYVHIKYCALIVDAISIRKQIIWDDSQGKFQGYCDLGGIPTVNSEDAASEALMFPIVAYKNNFKCPTAYFLTNKTNATLQAQLIDCCIRKLFEIGITVHSITCDGTAVLSSGVAIALDYLRVSGSADFQGSDATIEFIRKLDRIFDILNARNPFGKGFKAPIKPNSIEYFKEVFKETTEYLKTLTVDNVPVFHSLRKTFALGLSVAMDSMLHLACYLFQLEDLNLRYFLSYKCSQDHLELFFS